MNENQDKISKYNFEEEKELFKNANDLVRGKDYVQAISFYDKILSKKKELGRLFMVEAERLKRERNFAAVKNYYEKIKRLKRGFFEVYYNKALAHHLSGEYLEAIKSCNSALKTRPGSKNAIKLRQYSASLYNFELKENFSKQINEMKMMTESSEVPASKMAVGEEVDIVSVDEEPSVVPKTSSVPDIPSEDEIELTEEIDDGDISSMLDDISEAGGGSKKTDSKRKPPFNIKGEGFDEGDLKDMFSDLGDDNFDLGDIENL